MVNKPGPPSFTVAIGLVDPRSSRFAGKQGGNGDDDDNGGKVSKSASNYRPAEACQFCSMFLPKIEECTKVSGRVGPAGLCDYYEPAAEEHSESEEGDERRQRICASDKGPAVVVYRQAHGRHANEAQPGRA
jgi:hypothetical protein